MMAVTSVQIGHEGAGVQQHSSLASVVSQKNVEQTSGQIRTWCTSRRTPHARWPPRLVSRPVLRFVLSPSERTTLELYARRPTTAQGLALRARMVLCCATGATHRAIAADLGVTIQTVGKWRRRFVATRIAGLRHEPRPGAPRQISESRH